MDFDDSIGESKNIRYQHRGVKDILKSLLETPLGFHQIFVYPNIDMLREVYFHYIKILLEDENEIVIYLPYYERTDSAKNVLYSSSNNINNSDISSSSNIDENKNKDLAIKDVDRYINNGSLVIIDSDKAFSNVKEEESITKTKAESNHQIDKDNHTITCNNCTNNFLSLVRMSIYHAQRLRKEGITIIAEYGLIYNNNNNNNKNKDDAFEDLLELEKSIPYYFDKIQIRQICLYNQKDFFDRFTKKQKKEILDLHSRSIIMVE
jgi:hypothetical protein